MQYWIQGWKRTLLFLLVFLLTVCLAGCSGAHEVYLAGDMSEMAPETAGQTPAGDGDTGTGAKAQGAGDEVSPAGKGSSESTETAALDGAGNPAMTGADGSAEAEDAGSEKSPAGYVYVCGAVAQPGVYPMYEGMRVFEAITLAGGFSQEADQEWLNQAETVQDGERLYVYTQEETQELAQQTAGSSGLPAAMWAGQTGNVAADSPQSGQTGAASDQQRVNLNTADRELLKTLPGIGDAKADAIIQYRETNGPFTSIEDIQKISGIKSAVFDKIKDLITI